MKVSSHSLEEWGRWRASDTLSDSVCYTPLERGREFMTLSHQFLYLLSIHSLSTFCSFTTMGKRKFYLTQTSEVLAKACWILAESRTHVHVKMKCVIFHLKDSRCQQNKSSMNLTFVIMAHNHIQLWFSYHWFTLFFFCCWNLIIFTMQEIPLYHGKISYYIWLNTC